MFNQIPLGGAGWQVCHSDGQSKFISQFLQFMLPCPKPIAVGSAAVRLNEQALFPGKFSFPNAKPPKTNTGCCEFWCLMRNTDHYKACVVRRVVNTIRNRYAICLARIIAFQNIQLLAAVRAPWIFEVANQFALLGIYGNRRKTRFFVCFRFRTR